MSKKNVTRTALIIVCAMLILIGLGVLIAAITGADISGIFDFGASDPENPANNTIFVVSIVVSVLLIIGGAVALYFLNKGEQSVTSKWTTKELIFGALCVALSFVLSYIKIFHMPQGGSITPASMLPIFLFAYIYGTPHGLIVAIAYGLLQMIQDAYIVHWAQAILDYVLAFGALSLAGLFKKSIIPGIIAGGFGRFLFAFLSGFIFFAEYAPEGQSPVVYSLVYQITYIIPELAICIVIAVIPAVSKTINSLRDQSIAEKLNKRPARA